LGSRFILRSAENKNETVNLVAKDECHSDKEDCRPMETKMELLRYKLNLALQFRISSACNANACSSSSPRRSTLQKQLNFIAFLLFLHVQTIPQNFSCNLLLQLKEDCTSSPFCCKQKYFGKYLPLQIIRAIFVPIKLSK
jgi:hypothetical protein